MITVLVKSVWLRNICFSEVATILSIVRHNRNYGRRSLSKYGISYYIFTTADVNIHASNCQIWYRHPNKENTGNDEFQNVQRESKHGFLYCGNYILKYW